MDNKKVIISFAEYENLQYEIKSLKEKVESLKTENRNLLCPAGSSLYLVYRTDNKVEYRVVPPEQDRTELERAFVQSDTIIQELTAKCNNVNLVKDENLRLKTINQELIDKVDKLEKKLNSIKSTWWYKLLHKFFHFTF